MDMVTTFVMTSSIVLSVLVLSLAIRCAKRPCIPDYAKLSGVRLPEPLFDFRLDDASIRPYRPLRRPLHQTMGR